ncbi:MAG: sugar dehydratase/epimerase yfnG [Candidatus Entotheonella factor]|uniref:Sugar dehydratase/epimerase yfnG n=1 Tax=Entotheonella factor TaxID=1429438 RepID=W4L9G2_ENTF1|nr:GDP-mannose 4,6-dehydratase [Candidatus Entotheonella palauensis]ETW94733.1 MAG: sugar dehydratase/epimerase yfnG [Candidatus Entotheonella factor]
MGIRADETSFWSGRTVFVTGCTGLLGSWLSRYLVGYGATVVGLVRDWVPECELFRAGTVQQMCVVRGDVCDRELLERVLGEHEIDTVFHLAAQTIVGIANRNPVSTFETNVRGTWCVLEACRRSPAVKQIVVASSDKAYGIHETLPYAETSALQGQFPYDVSKSCADLIATSYAATYKLPVCVTRCGNLYGGGDLNWNRLIPGTIRSVLGGERPIIRSDGSYIRDYFYVEDGVLAYLALAQQLAGNRNLSGEAFNFSNEVQVSVLELVQDILRLAGRHDLTPDIRSEATHEIPHQYLDASKARRVLGWQPQFQMAEGIERTIEWYRTFLGSHGV